MIRLRCVVDTNVLFEGLTQKGGASGRLVEAWLAGLFDAYVSDALAYEYADVLSRKLSPIRWERVQHVLGALLDSAHFVAIRYTWRPISPDPKDDHVIDCVMNAGAIVITSNLKDFELAGRSLGFQVVSPTQAVLLLMGQDEENG